MVPSSNGVSAIREGYECGANAKCSLKRCVFLFFDCFSFLIFFLVLRGSGVAFCCSWRRARGRMEEVRRGDIYKETWGWRAFVSTAFLEALWNSDLACNARPDACRRRHITSNSDAADTCVVLTQGCSWRRKGLLSGHTQSVAMICSFRQTLLFVSHVQISYQLYFIHRNLLYLQSFKSSKTLSAITDEPHLMNLYFPNPQILQSDCFSPKSLNTNLLNLLIDYIVVYLEIIDLFCTFL